MKIAAIRTIALSCTVDPPYASAAGVQARRGGLLVEVETDDGIVGIGEAGPGGGVTADRHRKGSGAAPRRPGPAADRGAVAEDVRAHPAIRAARPRHAGD